jgi:ferredoxin--NADP+ reductase
VRTFEAELARILPAVNAIHQDPELGRRKIMEALSKAEPRVSDAKFRFEFLTSPVGMVGANGALTQLEVEDNILVEKDGKTSAKGTGNKRRLDIDSVIFAIGDKVDESFGLPTEWNEFVKNKEPRFPVDGISYESTVDGVFVGGWSRKASDGLVGYARKDGINAAKALFQYLQTKQPAQTNPHDVAAHVKGLNKPIVMNEDIKRLVVIEAEEAKKRGLEEFKFATNEEMLQSMGLN